MVARREYVDVCVIGSGISGLTVAKEAKQAGLSVVILEKKSKPGGVWTGRGIYECLRLQQSKAAFGLLDDWPESTPNYPTGLDARAMVNAFVDCHGLSRYVRFRTPAQKSVFVDDRWQTSTPYGTIESKWIAFAVGSLGDPNVPHVLDRALKDFRGSVQHSSSYFRPLGYANRHVLVVGYGASSVEIAADLARRGECASVTLVAPPKTCSGTTPGEVRYYEDWCLSRDLGEDATKYFCANPDEPSVTMADKNAVVGEAMSERHPRVHELLPEELRPIGGPLDGRIIVSEAFNDALSQGHLKVLAGTIESATSDSVVVSSMSTGGQDITLRADDLILCTGYEAPLPRIQNLVAPAPQSLELYRSVWSPDVPSAAFLGLGYGFISITQLAQAQARHFAAVASGSMSLPSSEEMRAWIESYGPTNLQGTTQCLTKNDYFANLFADLPYPTPPSSSKTASTTLSKSSSSPAYFSSPVRRIARNFSGQQLFEAQDDIALSLSSIGDELNESGFKCDDPSVAYAKWAETYDDDSFGKLKFDSPYSARDHVLSYLPLLQQRQERVQILDVGCGTGAIARLFREALSESERSKIDFVGFDLTPEMLDVARRRGHYRKLCQWSLSNTPWPFEGDSADMAVCNGVLVYVDADAYVLEEFCRIVRKGGHAILMIRDDNIVDWQPHIDALELGRMWKLVEVSESRDNFPGGGGSTSVDGTCGDAQPPITYKMYVFEILSPAT